MAKKGTKKLVKKAVRKEVDRLIQALDLMIMDERYMAEDRDSKADKTPKPTIKGKSKSHGTNFCVNSKKSKVNYTVNNYGRKPEISLEPFNTDSYLEDYEDFEDGYEEDPADYGRDEGYEDNECDCEDCPDRETDLAGLMACLLLHLIDEEDKNKEAEEAKKHSEENEKAKEVINAYRDFLFKGLGIKPTDYKSVEIVDNKSKNEDKESVEDLEPRVFVGCNKREFSPELCCNCSNYSECSGTYTQVYALDIENDEEMLFSKFVCPRRKSGYDVNICSGCPVYDECGRLHAEEKEEEEKSPATKASTKARRAPKINKRTDNN